MVTVMVTVGHSLSVLQVDTEYRTPLTSMRSSLDYIAANYPDTELCGMARDLSMCIATLGAVWSAEAKEHASDFKSGKKILKKARNEVEQILIHNEEERDSEVRSSLNTSFSVRATMANSDGQTILSPFQCALTDLKDPLVPMRGHALFALTKLISSRDEETLSNSSFLLDCFRANLCHDDSYVYLAAINALVALALSSAQTFSANVVRTLCQEYASLTGRPDPSAGCKYDRLTGQLKRRPPPASTSGHSVEVRMKLGEALVRVLGGLQDMLPHYLDDVIASLLMTVRDAEPLLRASSLSNIAEICSMGKLASTPSITEVFHYGKGNILQFNAAC